MSKGVIRRTDSSGDAILAEWDTADAASVARAGQVFDQEAHRGLMARCDEGTDLTGEKLGSFDPEASEILALGRFQGG